ncbi:MAG: hypothetical protein OXH06_14245 [Gemmatimonadetes bacterium]|nr:hypothetical protein [Gemmatimonadota bacterium]
MTRAMSIVLTVAIALQTIGCSTWRPLARAGEIPADDRQSSMRKQVLGRLTVGMRARIEIREGAPAPVIGRVIECFIEKVGPTSLTVTASARFVFPDNLSRRVTLRYSDIESVEYQESNRGFGVFAAGVVIGTLAGFYLLIRAIAGITLD